MSFATFQDANVHLDGKKITFHTAEEAIPQAQAADDLVSAALFDRYDTAVTQWVADDGTYPTPRLVRRASALLMAYFKYAAVYSEEDLQTNSYAMRLRREAQMILDGLRDGTLDLVDFTSSTGDTISAPAFFPDDQYVDIDTGEPIRMFTVEQEF